MIAPPEKNIPGEKDLQEKLGKALKTMSTKEAAASVAEETGASRKSLYEMALKIPKKSLSKNEH